MIKIEKIEKKSRSSQFGLNGEYLNAVVVIDSHTYHFTKGEDEKDWYCDALFNSFGVPIFCHGEGSRSCMKRKASDHVAQELNLAAS
jgi:hypothetical protein